LDQRLLVAPNTIKVPHMPILRQISVQSAIKFASSAAVEAKVELTAVAPAKVPPEARSRSITSNISISINRASSKTISYISYPSSTISTKASALRTILSRKKEG
jgi:hypothetical protein